MARKPDWKIRLITYLGEAARKPFQPGKHDCALFAAGAVKAMTGKDFARGYRGRYRTLKGGLKTLQKAGFADHIALAASLLEDIPVSFAGPGDLAVIATPDGPALGVVQGEGIYLLTMDDRMGLRPMAEAIRAFRVA
jgi:hypothetical protein